jgi:TonB-linked SusC/RagA family outer membrane protein
MEKQKLNSLQGLKKKLSFSGFLILLILLLSGFTANELKAQDRITGQVTNESGEPLIGATLIQKGTNNGEVTDLDGSYSILLVPGEKILAFSYTGYASKEVTVGTSSVVNVTLEGSSSQLDEVVVIGYAPVDRKKVLGAMSSVKEDEIVQATPIGAFDAVQGRLAGVQILSNGGPGAGFDIRVRGVSTFSGGGTSPLYVVDGQQLDDIDNLDPNDIASLEVLKDGATAAIYGSKAANGVVIITTKSGERGELKVDVSSVTSVSELVGDIRVSNTRQRILYERLRQDDTDNLTTQERDSLNAINRNSNDLQDLVTEQSLRQQINVGVRGGGEKGKFYWNTGFLNEDGIVLNSDYQRLNSLLKVDMTPNKRFNLGTKLNLTYEEQNGLQEPAVFQQLVERIPYFPIFEPNGDLSPEINARQNPVAETERNIKTRNYRAQTFSYAQLEILPKFSLKSTLGINYRLNKRDDFQPIITINPNSGIPIGRQRFTLSYDIQQENYFNYKNTWGNHDFGAFAGMQTQKYFRENLDQRANFISDDIETFNNIDPTTLTVLNAVNSRNNLFSLFAGFNYDYKNKYLVGATIRRDGSSRFGANNKFGYFPSLTLGWRVTNEAFLQDNKIISNLLIRASYGVTGNERIGNYDFTGAFLPGAIYDGVNGVFPTRLANPDLSWESTTSTNLGFDIGLLDNRIDLTIDLWEKNTTDLLANVPLPEESGFSAIRKNVGAVDNRGIDLGLGGSIFKTKDFTWYSSFNISYQENEVIKLDGGIPFEVNGQYIVEEGQPIGNMYGYKNLGVYAYDESNAYTPDGQRLTPNFDGADNLLGYSIDGAIYDGEVMQMTNAGTVLTGGDIIWEDLDNDFDITAADRQVIGNGLPDFFGGFSNDLKYKNFRLSFLFDFSYGQDIYRRWDEARNDLNSSLETPGPDRIEGAWREQGDVTVYPRLNRVNQNRERPNSFFVTPGDFVKLRYIRLNYDLSPSFLKRVKGIGKVSLNLAVNNVLTWTNYIGFNPELGNRGNPLTPGQDNLRYPNDREFIFGLKFQLK